jgi:hypothetical protein
MRKIKNKFGDTKIFSKFMLTILVNYANPIPSRRICHGHQYAGLPYL